jgi:hypothetical protein
MGKRIFNSSSNQKSQIKNSFGFGYLFVLVAPAFVFPPDVFAAGELFEAGGAFVLVVGDAL